MSCTVPRGRRCLLGVIGMLAALAGCAEGASEEPDPTVVEDADVTLDDLAGDDVPADTLVDDASIADASPSEVPLVDASTADLGASDRPPGRDAPTAPDLPLAAVDAAPAPPDVPPMAVDVPPMAADVPAVVRDAGPPPAVCGDGIVDRALGEACDDGNQADGDGCSADCRQVLCTDGSRRLLDPGGRCYWRDPTVSARADAAGRCASAGGYLAVFETEAEINAVYPAVGLGGSNRVWAAVQLVGATWTWDNGAPLTFTVFRGGEPSGDGPCAEWGPSNNFNDVPCNVRRDAVCERPPPGRAR